MSVVQTINIPDVQVNFSLEAQLELGEKKKNGDAKAREQLILSCVPLVKTMAKTPLCERFSSYDDAFQDGMLAVLKVVDSYDYTKGVKFTTFVYQYIHQGILRGILKQTPNKISEKDFFNSILINSTIESFRKAYYVYPTDEQLSKLTSIPISKIVSLRKQTLQNRSISFTDAINANLLPVGDIPAIVDNALKQTSQKRVINAALETLTAEEREIIEKRYLYAETKTTMRELSESQGVRFQTVAKREKTALKKLLLYFVENNITFNDLV